MRYLTRFAIIAVLLFSIIILEKANATALMVYPQGRVDVVVPVNQYLSVFTDGTARVYKQVGGPSTQTTPQFVLETGGTLNGNETIYGPYTIATTVRIEANADTVMYSVGALAVNLPVLRPTPRVAYTQFAPVAYNATGTVLASDLMVGLLTSTQATGATITLTLPTGTLTDAASGLKINQGFEWSLINLSAAAADTVTLAAGTGHTLVGTAVIPSAHSTTGALYGNAGRFFTRKTAANTFITYRLR